MLLTGDVRKAVTDAADIGDAADADDADKASC